MKTKFLSVTPVLPSRDIFRDIHWYRKFMGFEPVHHDSMYAVLKRENIFIHLQWHADTDDDPLLGGSVIRILVENFTPIFNEYIDRGTISTEKLRLNTPWNTNEFGFYDLNQNGIFILEINSK